MNLFLILIPQSLNSQFLNLAPYSPVGLLTISLTSFLLFFKAESVLPLPFSNPGDMNLKIQSLTQFYIKKGIRCV